METCANLLTHPTAWHLIRSMDLSWLAIEIGVGVATVELLIYRKVTGLSWQRATLAAFCASGITAALSFVL